MTNTITKTLLADGPRNLIILITIQGDGSGEETNTILVDRSTYAPTTGTKLALERLEGNLAGFTAVLSFDGTADLPVASLPNGYPFKYDWCDAGGVSSNKVGAGATGDLLITTASLGSGDAGTFTLWMHKG